ncbi:MAG: gliding motility-associated C-terminal domain-containing protein [Bacteroidota bacterium]|nr:gliding motility-associated C-terminal domain-containing protein [Bacteroidota bacterium]
MKQFFLLIITLLISYSSFATHQRAAEITYRHISGLTYEITILSFTYAPSPADRPELEIFWGDGTSSIVARDVKQDLSPVVRRNEYTEEHTFPGSGTYILSMEDPNRNRGVINIPNSVNVPIYVETELIINPFLGYNNSPQLLNPPLEQGCAGTVYIHNPGAYDIDGDSLSYYLVTCKGADGLDIPGYSLPETSNVFSINPITGDLIWDTPVTLGEYNVAFIIKEWRNGIEIGYVRRDMQIQIAGCSNIPPVISPLNDTCVRADDNLEINIIATDADGETISLSGEGGPLLVTDNPAIFEPATGDGSVSSTFSWTPICNHVRFQPYQMYFKAIDESDEVSLTDLSSLNITVIGHPPVFPAAIPLNREIELSWQPSPCQNVIGYEVYRKSGYSDWEPTYCERGIPASSGFTKIASLNGYGNTSYTDNNNGAGLVHGINYCYRFISVFPDKTKSYASETVCAALKRDVPIITNVSINNTDANNGEISLIWSKPTEIDIIEAPGPYKSLIYRLVGKNAILIDSLNQLTDTTYTDSNIDTKNNQTGYRIDLYNDGEGNRFYIGSSDPAYSLFINLTPSDNKIEININENVPWLNYQYTIYRKNSTAYDSINYTEATFFTDENLVNNKQYCYYIKSSGEYSVSGIAKPLINLSQKVCATPIDNMPPCAPQLFINTNCSTSSNELIWTNPNSSCADDVIKYNIFFNPNETGSSFTILDSINNPNDTIYLHENLNSIAGCYAISAIDSMHHESEKSNIVCVSIDSCSIYSLPNIFTPNGDGYNDYYKSFPYTSVNRIDLQIFNRYGRVVYKTTDPAFEWDGRNMNSNKDSSEGTYYYVCKVYEITLQGNRTRSLQGAIMLLR